MWLSKGDIDAAWVYGAVLNEKFGALTEAKELSDMSKTPVRLGTGLIASNELLNSNKKGFVALLARWMMRQLMPRRIRRKRRI